jgi:DNA-binding CsgD family transcriptional regulator
LTLWQPDRDAHLLSEREKDLLALYGQGLSCEEIGEWLFIGVVTVRFHLRNAQYVFRVKRSEAAVAKAVEMGVMPCPLCGTAKGE